MSILTEIFREPYQFLFVMSVLVLLHFAIKFFIRVYARVRLNKDTRFELTDKQLILLWVAISIFITFLI